MSERKVLNKYYPPDFDPLKIPRLRLPKERQYTVRLMAPCNMRCKTCGEYIYKGKKFNARKETVQNEDYLGIKVFRFYIKCPRCLAEITFKTDPANSDYIVEHGASRNFQALKLAEEAAEREAREEEEEEKNNPMKLLEKRTKASKQEMDLIEALEDLKDLNKRQANVNFDDMLGRYATEREVMLKKQEEEDEKFIASVFGKNEGATVKRIIEDSDEDSGEEVPKKPKTAYEKPTDILAENYIPQPAKTASQFAAPGLSGKASCLKAALAGLVRPKGSGASAGSGTTQQAPSSSNMAQSGPSSSTGLSLLGTYSASDESSSD
ncbi:splicing factor YJU2 [Dermacentor andersoni]|uniref:splicing factor YJU2 n=1 Tax=Dermacentor andersoni TaxID=34620 RepID=UPI002155D80A|nr:splicing factor YJU2-like [Dermacentor andersoni]